MRDFQDYFREQTVSADIAQATSKMPDHEEDCECGECSDIYRKEMSESPVGKVGRTGVADAADHVNAELRARFKKIVKELGGKTVARQLLAEMNAGS